MKTLYDQHPDAFEAIAARGGKPIADMAKHFVFEAEMCRALGYGEGAVRHWIKGDNFSARSIQKAMDWLAVNTGAKPSDPNPEGGAIYLVTCPPGTEAKAAKLLTFIGCEFVEVE